MMDIAQSGNHKLHVLMQAMKTAIGENAMMAYLSMMAVRLVELHRVLKPTGSLYLHCDPTASHYLKLLLDGIFGPENFRNEIIWERTNSHNMKTRFWPRSTDTILFYTKSESFTLNPQYIGYSPEQLSRFRPDENGRLYTGRDLTFSTVRRHRQFEWRGVKPPPHRSWGADLEQLEQWYSEGKILLRADGKPRFDGLKIYLDELPGKIVTNLWADIPRISNTGGERLGYPTQKPLTLLERIISAGSDSGQLVLDPFCGCGTAVHAAEALGRQWIGIDVTHLAISLIERRLKDAFPAITFDVHGVPRDLASARDLAARDKHQFQWWAVSLVDAVPQGGSKKGADRGIDGVRWVKTGPRPEDVDRVIVSVKGGHVSVKDVRDLVGTVAREKALGGLLITLEKPTRDMLKEAASHGYAEYGLGTFRRIMVKTIDDLLRNVHDEKEVLPPVGRQEGFRRAAREKPRTAAQPTLDI
jgi:site-specific DNA-methyltransferase (adenine-specific)